MNKHTFRLPLFIGKWFLLVIPVASLSGSASALFLKMLDLATAMRWNKPWLLFLLPPAGVLIVFIYEKLGGNTARGNNLLIDEIHEPGGGVSWRMAPLVLITSVATHLFGGSAGREGTAVQIGGSIASFTGKIFGLKPKDVRLMLMAGIAAGFGSIFGTPFAGAIFALEVLTIGRLHYEAIIPCLFAAILGHLCCSAWGVHHTQYTVLFSAAGFPLFSWKSALLLFECFFCGIVFGLVAQLFSGLMHGAQDYYARLSVPKLLRPVVGGIMVIILVYLSGTRDFLGLGVQAQTQSGVSILQAFRPENIGELSWLWKLLFTVITLASGFKGGEVTPLFFIGACLGNTLAWWLNAPIDLFAAMGFIALFAGASNTPLASTIMGAELFGTHNLIFFALASFTAYFFSGHTGIYLSQRLDVGKTDGRVFIKPVTLLRLKKLHKKRSAR